MSVLVQSIVALLLASLFHSLIEDAAPNWDMLSPERLTCTRGAHMTAFHA